jgi:hypothetical protein
LRLTFAPFDQIDQDGNIMLLANIPLADKGAMLEANSMACNEARHFLASDLAMTGYDYSLLIPTEDLPFETVGTWSRCVHPWTRAAIPLSLPITHSRANFCHSQQEQIH